MEEPECIDAQPHLVATRFSKESIMNLERELDKYSKLVVSCNERIQMMHSPTFNNEQCQYLIDTLKEVIKSSNAILEPSHGAFIGSCATMDSKKHLLSFKLLLVLATKVERFIEGCSQDPWVPNAMTWTNALEFVSTIGFHLELCQVALSKKSQLLGGLNFDQVVIISSDVHEIVKTKALIDKEDLLKKISLGLPSLHGDMKDLASYLLQRLLNVTPIPSMHLPESKWAFSQYFSLLRSMFEKVKQGVSLGRGSSASVFRAIWLEMEVAVKVFYGEDNPNFKKEVDVHARLCHPNITSMFCCTQEKRKCSIVMELMDGDLFTLMQQRLEINHDYPPFDIWEAIDIMHQIAEGGKYLHEQGVVHRDLKSQNILIKRVKIPGVNLEHIHAKVADFNVSKIKQGSTTHSTQTMNVGTNRWMAPELIQLPSSDNYMNVEGSTPKAPMYPNKCDIYSFAMVCYEILTGELPFSMDYEDAPKKMKAMILEGDRPKLPVHCPFPLRDLIEKCWNPKPKSRPTFDDICRDLKFMKYLLMAGISSTFEIEDTYQKRPEGNASNYALKDMDEGLEATLKLDDHFSNIATHLTDRAEVKRMMGNFEDALEDLNMANELKPNVAKTLAICGEVKKEMGKYVDALENFNKAHELKSNDAFTLRSRGQVKGMMGNFEDALEDLNKADELQPHDAFILRSRGQVKRMMNNYANALEDFNKANELEPNDAFTLAVCGEVKKMMSKFEDALEDLNKADKLKPNTTFILRNRGQVKRMMGKYSDALEDFNKANELEPNDAFTLVIRGEVKKMMSKFEDALEDLNKADKLKPNDAFTLKIRGQVKRMMGKYIDAFEDLDKVNEIKHKVAFTFANRGEVKIMVGKYIDALEDLNKANELKPNDAFILRNRGEAKKMMGQYVDALEDFNKVDELKPNDAFILRNRGEVKRMMGKFDDALEDLNKAHELKPDVAFTLRYRGEMKRMMEKFADALEDLNKAHELKPNDALTLAIRGEVKGKIGNYIEALEDCNKANELEPNNAMILANRGEVKKMMGKFEDALEDLNKAHDLKPNVAFTLAIRGEVKKMMGKFEDALEDLNKANELEPNVAFTLRNRGHVKRMMGKFANALEDLKKADELQPIVAFTLEYHHEEVKQMMGKFDDVLEDFNI